MKGSEKKESKVRAFIEIARPINWAMAASGVVIGAIVGAGLDLSLRVVVSATLAVVLTTAGGNASNDYFDQQTDAIVHPNRPLPSHRISSREALYFILLCFTGGILVAIEVNFVCFLIALLNTLVLLGYNRSIKKYGIWGNMTVSYLVGSTFLFGGAAVGKLSPLGPLALLAFLATLSREIVKDAEDISGDQDFRTTLPLQIGQRRAVKIAGFLLVVLIALSFLPYILGILKEGYLMVVVFADAIFGYSIQSSLEDPSKGKNWLKVGMILALIAFLVGGIT